ncbi:piggyBac transposable element-derived protein 4-like [Penaeus chinensis]|uniref:piggyBac transposable element-derived protein 4-like n=1 Tax=Penaeus chinensis TaxID=139456 RepID=UPI001FB64CCD|nr:piggyBac transposable element-derived protein 4-like [Penaeus chinensis]
MDSVVESRFESRFDPEPGCWVVWVLGSSLYSTITVSVHAPSGLRHRYVTLVGSSVQSFPRQSKCLSGSGISNHKAPVSKSTMSDKKHSETIDGLIIKEESDTVFVADNDTMEKVKEEREDEMIVWKIEDDVTFKEESLDTNVEDDSYPYEDCEDPLLTLKCKSCEVVCATRRDLETHTKNKHGSGKHPRGQKRDRLHDHGRSSCDEIASSHSSCYSDSDSDADDNLVVPSTSAVPTALSHSFNDFNLSSDECDKIEYIPKRRGRLISSSSDDGSDSELEASFQEKHASEQPVFVWQRKLNVPKQFGFCARPVVNVSDLHQGSTPFEIYSHFITPKLMDCLVQETNRYYHQQPAPPSSHKRNWHNTSREELHAYFGLWLLMDLHPRSDIEMYWQDPIFYQPMFPKTMSLDRFIQLTQNLHVVDNSATHPGDDCLWKFRPLLSMLNQQFSSVYTSPQKITVDDSPRELMGQFGLKMYKLCVSDGMTAGYTIALSIYSDHNKRKLPTSMRAIVELMAAADLFGKGYELHTNSRYTSPSLFQYLQSQHTNAIGTVYTIRRYMPIDLKTTAYGDVDLRSTPTGILCLQWHNKEEPITMLSTVHSGMVTNTPQSKKKHMKPKVVSDYIAGTKGVDMTNQFLLSYQTVRKSIKWYKKVILYLLDIAVVNSFCVHQALGGMLSQFDFQVQLIRDLLQESTAIRRGIVRKK